MIRSLLIMLSAVLSISTLHAGNSSPIISGYGGWWLDRSSNNYDISKMYLNPMLNAGFTGIDLKIFSRTYGKKEIEELKKIIATIHAHKLKLYAYATPWTHKSVGSGKILPAFVNEAGKKTQDICLLDYSAFRKLYTGAFKLAELSGKYNISSVKIDLEFTASKPLTCYCDNCWKRFAAAHKELSADTPPEARHEELVKHKLVDVYSQATFDQWEKVAIAFEREMHAINPELVLGMMPAEDRPVYLPFIRRLATGKVPAIMDSWCMYHGNGYNKLTRDTIKWIKAQNPNNIPVPWFRINYYTPEAITSQVYSLLKDNVGYTLYALSSMRTDWDFRNPRLIGYKLPGKYTIADYWNAFKAGNDEYKKYCEAVAAGKKYQSKIKTEMKPLVATCRSKLIKPLKLKPYSESAKLNRTAPLTLRHENFFYVEASPTEPVSFDIEHMSGRHPTAIAIEIIDPETGKVLLPETVAPGESRSIVFPVEQKKVYAVIFSSGDCGPWYRINFKSKRFGAYGYRDDQRENFYFFAPFDGRKIYLLPEKGAREFQFRLNGGPLVYKLYAPDGSLTQEGRLTKPFKKVITQKLTAATQNGLWKLELKNPGTLVKGEYIQNAWFGMLKGLEPIFSFTPESMLTVDKKNK